MQSHTQNILQFLRSNGASRFADMLRNDYEVDSYINDATIILAPSDEVLQNLDPQTDTHELVSNHVSITPVNKTEFPVFFSRSGVEHGNDIKDLHDLGINVATRINSTTVLVIRKFVPIVDYAIYRTWAKLPTDIFNKLILDNNVKGKDLISLCVSNSNINEKCNWKNQQLFRHLLRRDYDIDEPNNPRDLYSKVAMAKIYLFGENYYVDEHGSHNNPRLAEMRVPGYENPEITSVAVSKNYMAFLSPNGVVTAVGIRYDGNIIREISRAVQIPISTPIVSIEFGRGADGGILRLLDANGKFYHTRAGRAVFSEYYIFPPVELELPFRVKSFSGYQHIAFLDYEGHVWTTETNARGQLGRHTVDKVSMVPGFSGVRQVKSGSEYTVILDADGVVWIIGAIPGSPPGIPANINPVRVEGVSNVKQISAGYNHMGFIDEHGQSYFIGPNNHGQLGDAPASPTRLGEIILGPAGIRFIHCGFYTTLLITNDRRVLYAGWIPSLQSQMNAPTQEGALALRIDGFAYLEGAENVLYATSSEAGLAIIKY